MIAGPTSTVLHPLRTIAGAAGVGGNNSDDNGSSNQTTTTDAVTAAGNHPGRTTTTVAGATTTTRHSSRTTTTVAGATTTSAVSGGGGDPAPPPIVDCKSGDLAYSTATNKSSYRPNEQVTISMKARNASDRPCYAPNACGIGPWASVEDSSGVLVWKNSPKTSSCAGATQPLLNPHDTHDYGTVGVWNQLVCPQGDGCTGSHAAVGTYRAIARRGSTTAGGVTFALRS
jgi:hypothetical protein